MGARLQGRQPVILTLRKSPDSDRITPEWRAEIDGRAYNIREHGRPSENRMYVEMLAEGGVEP